MDDVRLSKLLSLVLRHRPERIGVTLDEAGWIDVEVLLAALSAHGTAVGRDDLERVVTTSDKQRFALDGERIRANQGHSVPVDLGLVPTRPPDVLYHGTPTRSVASIRREGLKPGRRHAVHLSPDVDTAHRVGARRGEHTVLTVDSRRMEASGHRFTVSANGVWLVDAVPAESLGVAIERAPDGLPRLRGADPTLVMTADEVRGLIDESRGAPADG